MDTTTAHLPTRSITAATRRFALRGVIAGVVAAAGGARFQAGDTAARRKGKGKSKKKKMKKSTYPAPEPPTVNECAEKNWCVDRSQTCGSSGGYGKCLVEATGGNLCAEILFQAATCAECAAPACQGCRCALAAGGGDRCNNGTTGFDFICVRSV